MGSGPEWVVKYWRRDGRSRKVGVVKPGGVSWAQQAAEKEIGQKGHSRRGRQEARRVVCKGGRGRLRVAGHLPADGSLRLPAHTRLTAPFPLPCAQLCLSALPAPFACSEHSVPLSRPSCFHSISGVRLLGLNPGSSAYQLGKSFNSFVP